MIQQQGQSVIQISLQAFIYLFIFFLNLDTVEQKQSEDKYRDTWWPSRVELQLFFAHY